MPAEVSSKVQPRRRIGRYGIFGEIASGGMATVYFGRLIGAVGFSRSVAIKQLHPQYARSPEFVAQFLDEAQLTARIRHPNVVQVLDVVARDGELFVIMEYVEGEPLSRLMRAAAGVIPIPIASSIVIQALLGLHAAHDAKGDNGLPLDIVHRDVSPQNILVGVDGSSHILDFGVAKASSRVHTTENGQIKGKLTYMAPEQLQNRELDRRVDLFAMGVVLWELLAGRRLFARSDPGATVAAVLGGEVQPPSQLRPEITPALEAVVMKALAPDPAARFDSAREMALALEQAAEPASALKTGAWVESVARDAIAHRASLLREAEEESSISRVSDPASLQRSLAGVPASVPPSGPVDATKSVDAPPSKSWTKPAILAGAVAIALLAYAVVASRTGQPSAARPTPTPPPPAIQAAPPEVAAPEAVPAAPSTPAIDLDAPEPPASAAPQTAATGKATKRAAPKPRATAANCTPPFVLDAQGRKRFKPECF
jgi:eukaryotic-like serine/threonine-protein kinase